MNNDWVLKIEDLTVGYDARPVLWHIHWEVPAHELVAIVGPNGSGKSTLIKSVVGLIKPLRGKIQVLGGSWEEHNQEIAYVPQRESIDWDFPVSIEDVVWMGRELRRPWWRRRTLEDREWVAKALETTGLQDLRERQLARLSGGQRQRVFIARALAQGARFLILDEPFAGVDAKTEDHLLQILRGFVASGGHVLMVHHQLSTLRAHFDHVLLLNRRVIRSGKPQEVLTPENLMQAYGAMPDPLEQLTDNIRLHPPSA